METDNSRTGAVEINMAASRKIGVTKKENISLMFLPHSPVLVPRPRSTPHFPLLVASCNVTNRGLGFETWILGLMTLQTGAPGS
jgi:hypothetical protein